MKKSTLIISLFTAVALLGCGESKTETPKQTNQSVETATPGAPPEQASPVKPDHFYSMRDGNEYGYERAISNEEQNQGQAANKLLMLKFAGQKDGKYQVYTQDKQTFGVFECSAPCDYIKTMVFFGKEHIKTERIKGGTGSIAGAALTDAINGKLEQAKVTRRSDKSKKVHIWFNEDSGVELTPIDG